MVDELGFSNIAQADTYDAIKRATNGTDLIFAFAFEQRPRKHMEGLITLDSGIKLILYMHDIHYAKERRNEGATKLLDRADLVLVPYWSYFKRAWPQFVDKAVFFPHFFASHDRYCSLEFHENPKMKCLLTGNIKSNRYPIRWRVSEAAIRDDKMKQSIDILRHPRHAKTQHWTREEGGKRTEYGKTINEYFCSVADASKWHLLLTKYLEIPAAGALLLGDEPEDGRKVGLIPGEHYLLVSKDNVLDYIYDCLENPEKYNKIRRQGMEFVRANHSVENRLAYVAKLVQRVV